MNTAPHRGAPSALPGSPPGQGSDAITAPGAGDADTRRATTDAIARGDPRALAQLYDEYAARAFGLALRVVGDRAAAEDVVHDAFLWFWENAHRVDGARGNAGALLLTITHRRSIDHIRRRSRTDGRTGSLDGLDPGDEEAVHMLTGVEEAALIEQVRDCMEALNPDQREVIELAYFGGLTHAEIAERQQLPGGTVKSRLRLGLEKLRSILQVEKTE